MNVVTGSSYDARDERLRREMNDDFRFRGAHRGAQSDAQIAHVVVRERIAGDLRAENRQPPRQPVPFESRVAGDEDPPFSPEAAGSWPHFPWRTAGGPKLLEMALSRIVSIG